MVLYYGTGLENAQGIVKNGAVLSRLEQKKRDLAHLFRTQDHYTQYGTDLDFISQRVHGRSFDDYALSFERAQFGPQDVEREVKAVALTDRDGAIARSIVHKKRVVLGFNIDPRELREFPPNVLHPEDSATWYVPEKVDLAKLAEVHILQGTFTRFGRAIQELFRPFKAAYFVIQKGEPHRIAA